MELDPDSPSSEDMARLWDYLSDHLVKVAPAAKAKRPGIMSSTLRAIAATLS